MTDLIQDEFDLDHDTLMALEEGMKIHAKTQSEGITRALKVPKGETGVYTVKFSDGAVKTFKVGGKWSFDDLVNTMEVFNAKQKPVRCLSVSRNLRGVNHCVIAAMENNIIPNCNIKAKNPVLSEIYCI